MFEPFQPRRGGSGDRGAGLGLAIARGFAEANGGRALGGAGPRGRAVSRRAARARARAVQRVTGARILVVDDEPQILRALADEPPRRPATRSRRPRRAAGALAEAALRQPEAVILDLVLPDGSGTDVCRELRTWSTVPVIVLSAVGDEGEKVAALDAGADDYVTKPFGIDELLARLRAALRRVPQPTPEPVIEIGDLVIDLEKRAVHLDGQPVQLTPHEFDLLRCSPGTAASC